MSKLQNNFTTKEQSNQLLRLGLPRISANLYYDDEDELQLVKDKEHELIERGYFPCWSVGRLIEIFETCTSTKFERWSHRGVIRPLLKDCIEHIEFAINPDTIMEMDFSKLEE